jgi:hypothetical protein
MRECSAVCFALFSSAARVSSDDSGAAPPAFVAESCSLAMAFCLCFSQIIIRITQVRFPQQTHAAAALQRGFAQSGFKQSGWADKTPLELC